jgi:hypothetical protein
MINTKSQPSCATCAYFCNDPAYLERAIPGLSSMSSGYASVRSDDGVCAKTDRYLSSRSVCAEYELIRVEK